MTSLKQIEANRRNALKSTGPRSEEGKQRASQNAVRHGLTAETVIEPTEDREDYKAFEQAVAANYDAESAVERELVLRLVSLLWRLRRATSIETGLFDIERDVLSEGDNQAQAQSKARGGSFTTLFSIGQRPANKRPGEGWTETSSKRHTIENEHSASEATVIAGATNMQTDVARRFLRLAKLDNGVFEKLGRYEMALWRQVRQTLFTLEGLRWQGLRAPYPRRQFWRREAQPD